MLLDLGAARHAINDRDRKHTAVLKVNYAPIEQYASGDAELPQGPWSKPAFAALPACVEFRNRMDSLEVNHQGN